MKIFSKLGHHNTKYLTLPIAVFVFILSIMGSSMKNASELMFSPWIRYVVPGVLTLILVAYFVVKKKWFFFGTLVPVLITMIMLFYYGYRLLFGNMHGGITPVVIFLLPFIGYLIFCYYEYIYYNYD